MCTYMYMQRVVVYRKQKASNSRAEDAQHSNDPTPPSSLPPTLITCDLLEVKLYFCRILPHCIFLD